MENYFTEYEMFERKAGSVHIRRCIDGSITGSCKCIGYCKYKAHEGFLTKDLRRKHNCIVKNCGYYVRRERSVTTKELRVVRFSLTETLS